MINGYTHLISYEKYNKFFRAWMPSSFRTVEPNLKSYQKMFSNPSYRNVTVVAI